MRFPVAHAVLLPTVFAASLAQAQPSGQVREFSTTIERSPAGGFAWSMSDDRAWLGISTTGGGKRDTLGLLVQSVSPNSPAEKAGLEEGMRLQAINGVNLKLDPVDAGEPELAGMMQRRLTRELAKTKPGDEVELKVWANGSVRTLRAKTIEAGDAMGESFASIRRDMKNRAVLGVGLHSGGSKRDTLGILITSVSADGPADKAGIGEGDRIAAIDGTDLRVPREDAGDEGLSGSRANRLTRVLRDRKPGDEVTLKVFQNGRMRDLKVKLGKPEDLSDNVGAAILRDGDATVTINGRRIPMPPLPPRARIMQLAPLEPQAFIERMAPLAPRVRVRSSNISI